MYVSDLSVDQSNGIKENASVSPAMLEMSGESPVDVESSFHRSSAFPDFQ
jgi:hypothetical protein